jgi:hypothetical protein
VENYDSLVCWNVDGGISGDDGVWANLGYKIEIIRKAGGVPATGAPMPKLVFDYE